MLMLINHKRCILYQDMISHLYQVLVISAKSEHYKPLESRLNVLS